MAFRFCAYVLPFTSLQRRGDSSIVKMTAHVPHNPPPAIYPKNSKKMKLLDIDPLELARQMTIMESKLFCTIRASECLQRSQDSSSNRSDNIRGIILTSNKVCPSRSADCDESSIRL